MTSLSRSILFGLSGRCSKRAGTTQRHFPIVQRNRGLERLVQSEMREDDVGDIDGGVLSFEEHVIAQFARPGNAHARCRNVWTKFSVVHEVLNMNAVQKERGVGYQPTMTAPPDRFRTQNRDARRRQPRKQCSQSASESIGFHVVRVRSESGVA